MPVRPKPPTDASIERLLGAIRGLERSLRSVGLPRILSRLPLWWLCWHYCRMLDGKIERIGRLAGKFQNWLPMVRIMATTAPTRLELIDADQCLNRDIENTKTDLWALRNYCLDVARMFDNLGYASARMRRRQHRFLALVEQSCASACILQEEMAAHDRRARALLGAEQGV